MNTEQDANQTGTYIADVHNICPANGLVFAEKETRVACLALVSTYHTGYPGMAMQKIVIGLSADDLENDLIGMKVEHRNQWLAFPDA